MYHFTISCYKSLQFKQSIILYYFVKHYERQLIFLNRMLTWFFYIYFLILLVILLNVSLDYKGDNKHIIRTSIRTNERGTLHCHRSAQQLGFHIPFHIPTTGNTVHNGIWFLNCLSSLEKANVFLNPSYYSNRYKVYVVPFIVK